MFYSFCVIKCAKLTLLFTFFYFAGKIYWAWAELQQKIDKHISKCVLDLFVSFSCIL